MGSNFLVLGFYTFTSLFNSSRKTTVTTVTLRKQFVCYDNAKSLSKNKCDKSSKFNQSIRELQYCYIGPFTLSCSGECSTNAVRVVCLHCSRLVAAMRVSLLLWQLSATCQVGGNNSKHSHSRLSSICNKYNKSLSRSQNRLLKRQQNIFSGIKRRVVRANNSNMGIITVPTAERTTAVTARITTASTAETNTASTAKTTTASIDKTTAASTFETTTLTIASIII